MNKQNEKTQQSEPDPSGGVDVSDITQLQAENAELKAAIRTSEARSALTTALAKAGARSPGLLFDAVKGELKFTEDGKLENAAGLIEQITARFPEQFGTETPASIDGGAGSGGGITLTKEALAKMKPAEIAALDWSDVRRVLATG